MPALPEILIHIPRNPAIAIGVPVGLGFATGFLTRNSKYGPQSIWYKSLQKPSGNPPNWSFGVVWPTLYVCMGWSSHLMVKALERTPPGFGRDRAHLALGLYWGQLALNKAWSAISFGTGNLGLALIDIVSLTGAVGYLIHVLQDVEPTASYFLAPYIAWLSYATYLNGSLWWNNFGKHQFANLRKKAD
ncbi:TspO/MBR-related protein [Tilletiaria anomala UBC 951]|uniref:TspO/MBR-related protein n=1 Tax=Tilletiaria anomala (strain ATCC 24038 / CBS 436.72 / UBC 951) TaxID=1037660 RepID=A0A066WQ71_TILAU|nr:TspO/MBR-related protein [Tilletiaria anomala UBC 951]KDN53154.1 TspO/MBR-related protein [Tilletiaria anomala UBC 951]